MLPPTTTPGRKNPVAILEQVINGLLLGGTYSLLAIGYTLVFGVLRLLNMAHGETLMLSSFVGVFVALVSGRNDLGILVVSFGVAVLVGAALGLVIERLAFYPLRHAHELAPLISTLGIGVFLEEFAFTWSRKSSYLQPDITGFHNLLEFAGWNLGPLYIRASYLTVCEVAAVLMVGLHVWVRRTRMGRAIRAVAENPMAAQFMGVDVERAIVITFVLSSALAGAAGMLIATADSTIYPAMGRYATLTGLVVMVIGGMGNVVGAMIGGLIFGVLQTTAGYLWSTSYRDIVAFGLLILFLVIRPQGLFGSPALKRS